MIKATPSNVAGSCVGWEPPRWSFRLRSQLVQTPMHRDSMSGPRATLREVIIATDNPNPSILSGVPTGFDSTRHRAALRPNKSPATGGGLKSSKWQSPPAPIACAAAPSADEEAAGALRKMSALCHKRTQWACPW
jgi:hypothetical protein